MKLLEEYFKLQKQIYDHFDYVENWKVIPLSDDTEYFWHLEEFAEGNGTLHFAESRENLRKIIENNYQWNDEGINSDDYYTNEIYTQRFLEKWVYRAEDYTMVCVDTQTDGNKFLSILDNAKEIE